MYVKISLQKGKKTPLISLIKFSFIVSTNQLNKPQKWSSHCGARGSAASRHSEFKRIWCCLSCRIDPNCGNCSSDLIPGVGTPYADSQKKKKKKKNQPLHILGSNFIVLFSSRDNANIHICTTFANNHLLVHSF